MDRLIAALGYVRLRSGEIEAWRRMATTVLGMSEGEGGEPGTVRLRMDERAYRFELVPGEGHAVLGVGWEVPDEPALQRVEQLLAAHGLTGERGTRAQCDARAVSGLLTATDPAGIPVDFFWGACHAAQRFVSPTATGFVTGILGMGHVVFRVPTERHAAQLDFYAALGFRLSDRFRRGEADVRFLRCNARHHSLALGAMQGPPALVHFMLETTELDMVGLALEAALAGGARVQRGLGRHTNDRMLSFYAQTPGGFDVEYGWGGRLVDDTTWSVAEVAGGTLWGHHPPTPTQHNLET